MTVSNLKKELTEEFADKEYAHAYMHHHLLERFAIQLNALRGHRRLSQHQLADLSGVPQGKISLLECAEVESFTLATALKLAKAFDVGVRLEFEPFSRIIGNVDRSSASDLVVKPRQQDLNGLRAVNKLFDGVQVQNIVVTTTPPIEVTDVPVPSR